MVQYPQGHAVACTCTTYASAAKPRALRLLNHHSASVEPLACDVAAHFTNVKCECGIISTRHVCVQIVWQNKRREGACSFHRRRSLSLLVFPVGKSFALWAAPPLPGKRSFPGPLPPSGGSRVTTFGGSKPPHYGQTRRNRLKNFAFAAVVR